MVNEIGGYSVRCPPTADPIQLASIILKFGWIQQNLKWGMGFGRLVGMRLHERTCCRTVPASISAVGWR